MLPPGQAGMNGPPKPGGNIKEESDMGTPLNPGPSGPTPGTLLNNPPMNPQRPPTASAPVPTPAPAPAPPPQSVSMTDLPFDMSEMFTNGSGDFDFSGSLGDMELWFDPASVQEPPLDMK